MTHEHTRPDQDSEDRDMLLIRLLSGEWGPTDAPIATRLAQDETLRRVYERLRATADLLDRAAAHEREIVGACVPTDPGVAAPAGTDAGESENAGPGEIVRMSEVLGVTPASRPRASVEDEHPASRPLLGALGVAAAMLLVFVLVRVPETPARSVLLGSHFTVELTRDAAGGTLLRWSGTEADAMFYEVRLLDHEGVERNASGPLTGMSWHLPTHVAGLHAVVTAYTADGQVLESSEHVLDP